MGCKVSKSSLTSPFNEDGPEKKERNHANNNSDKNPISPELSQMNSSKKDIFKITHSDFVVEKVGKINLEYSLILPPIGKGAFGEVRRAVHKKTNVTRAVKIIYKESTDKEEQERLVNEVQILKRLDHPNIMKVFEFYQDEKAFYIVSELYTGGELFDKISDMKFFTEKMAAITMRQILSAVVYCHQQSIVHRDLKPENILYDSKKEDATLKVIDFGTSRNFDPNKKMNQKFGTPYYIAPEVLNRKYNEKCDVWSCGIILYILLCGYPPFNGPNDKVIMEKVSIGQFDYNSVEWESISQLAKDFIDKLLKFNPNERYSAEQAIVDPWLTKQISSEDIDRPLAQKALSNLKTFRADRKLQEATWLFLVNFLANKDEKKELLKTFQALDKNGDGQLNREELISGYRDFLGATNPEEEVDTLMKVVDYNNSGTIDYTEFVVASINRRSLLSKERLESAFKLFDKDGNGYLTIDELKDAFGANFDDDVWEEVIKECDENSDGKISFKEFKEMMMKLIN